MNIYNIIEDIQLSVGETKRMNCPNCNGYKTFTITNNAGAILWNCYKVTCNIKGKSRVRLTVDDIRNTNKVVQERKFVLPEYIVPMEEKHLPKYFYDIDTSDILHDVKENRVVFPIRHDGELVDAIGKAEKRLPKWKRYGKSNMPYVSWSSLTQTCVLVEDCFSACVAQQYGVTGVAILGTSLTETHKQFLSNRMSRVIVALDPDALQRNLQIAKELRSWVIEVKVLRLTDDLKYRKTIDINKLQELVWN
tara:strand:- start:1826 stop:2575 length:750 start_codon:yes stop_codon:yes gene_type:complete